MEFWKLGVGCSKCAICEAVSKMLLMLMPKNTGIIAVVFIISTGLIELKAFFLFYCIVSEEGTEHEKGKSKTGGREEKMLDV